MGSHLSGTLVDGAGTLTAVLFLVSVGCTAVGVGSVDFALASTAIISSTKAVMKIVERIEKSNQNSPFGSIRIESIHFDLH